MEMIPWTLDKPFQQGHQEQIYCPGCDKVKNVYRVIYSEGVNGFMCEAYECPVCGHLDDALLRDVWEGRGGNKTEVRGG